MKRAKKITYHVLIGIFIIGTFVLGFAVINTMVSLKYETTNSTGCISLISGQDFCFEIKVLIGLLVACIVAVILLLFFRKSISRTE